MTTTRSRLHRTLAALLAGAACLGGVACGDQEVQQRQAEAPDDGMQLTGRVGGSQLSVSYGDPDFQITDCDREDGADFDWCLRGRSIDGAEVVLVFENPAVLVPGETVDVDFDRCTGCDDVTTGAVVDLRLDGTRRRAIDGSVEVREAGPRYVAEFRLRFDDGGSISGTMNVRPLGVIVPGNSPSASPSEASGS